jgi:acyl transferase domain-containing protein/NAD(P)-dependent dehydrogenase (short-subunit alcohol dehydrogenase family)
MTESHVPLAIVGIGCLFPKAAGLDEYWANIKNKVDGIGPVPPTHWNPDDYFDADPKRPDMTYARRGGFLDPYPFPPAEFGIAPNDLEATDTSQLLALLVAKMALEDAEVRGQRSEVRAETREHSSLTPDPRPLTPVRTSVILGVTGTLELVVPLGARLGHPLWRKALRDCGVSDDTADAVVERISRGYVGWQESSFPGLLGNVVAGRVANRLDLNGTNCVVDAACASSLSALHLATLELQTGRAEVAITGGVDTFNDIFMYMCFSKTPALSPTGDAKPFDANGDGTILGEGLGIVVLKRLADAERDGNRIYAVIKGIGTSSDGKGNAIYAPSSAGQVKCLRDAYKNAGVTPDTIELIEAHGTGTKVGDAAEVEGLTQVFRDALSGGRQPPEPREKPWCALGSVKSQVGHTKAAAGAAGLIKAALALYHKVLPPTIKVTQPLVKPGATPFYVNTECRPWLPRDAHPRRAGVSAFGFGGSNFHCVLEEYGTVKREIDWDGDVAILALSDDLGARSARKGFEEPLLALRAHWSEFRARAAESRRTFNPAASHRLIIVAERNRIPDLDAILNWLNNPSRPAPDGVYYGTGSPPGKLGFLFPGQGSQSVGMLRDLACTFPVMQEVLAQADRAFAAGLVNPGETRLSDYIYLQPAFTAEARAAQEESLRETAIAQPALGAVSLGALQVLAHFGVKPDATAGHSYGELTALCAAGCFDAPSLFELSQLRGRLMASSRADDAGGMLAVQAPLEKVESLIREDQLELVIANKNGPTQAVLSGRTTEINRAATTLQSRRVAHVRLPVAAAFHSAMVANAAEPFRAALEPISFHTAQLPVFANTTAREYPRDPQMIRDILAQQIAKPVEFVEQVRNMVRSGVRTFVEVGPGRVLTRLVQSILAEEPHHAVALEGSNGKRSGMVDLARTLAQLSALGHAVRLAEWDPNPPTPTAKSTLTVPICGANYRKPVPELPRFAPAVPAAKPTPQSVTVMNPKPIQNAPALQDALKVTQESLTAFQRLQEQTAQLHKQFLDTQEAAQRTLQTLVEGQQRIVATAIGSPVSKPASSPAPLPQSRERGEVKAPTLRSSPPRIVEPKVVPQYRASEPPFSTTTQSQAERTTVLSSPGFAGEGPGVRAGLNPSHVQSTLIGIIAEKTGYPPEMLGPDMGLDADLGIDSIKRVEILSALQEKLPDAPVVKPEHLGTLTTLRHIVEFLCSGSPPVERNESGAAASPPDSLPCSGGELADVEQLLIQIVAEKTGYPPDMLQPNMGLDADLGIDSIKRVEILSAIQEKLPDAPVVKPEHLGTLTTLRQIAEFLTGGESTQVSNQATETSQPVNAANNISLDRRAVRVIDLPAGAERPLANGSTICVVGEGHLAAEVAEHLRRRGLQTRLFGWHEEPSAVDALNGLVLMSDPSIDNSLDRALAWLKKTGSPLRKSRGILTSVTHLDGEFGLSPAGPLGDPALGALAGIVKTASHEWPEVACKAIDCATGVMADAIVDEVLRDGPLEVGLSAKRRVTIDAVSESLDASAGSFFGRGDVIVISGGARGVTAEVAVEFARTGATLALLGRSPMLQPASPEVQACADEPALKRQVASRGGMTPKQVDAEVKAILAGREIRRTLERIAAAGGNATYHCVDVRDANEVRAAVLHIREQGGPITALIHGAGVLADRRIEDLSEEQFNLVYDTKVGGLHNLLAATTNDPLKALVFFSSSTGRYGRTGQAAYAAANEALNKIAQRESRRRPNCKVLSINWGPWAGGMVNPSLANLFAAEGITLIPLADGARQLVAELNSNSRAVEIVVLGHGSRVPESSVQQPALHRVFERELDLERAPVLRAHVIDGRAVLPLALTLEWLAHAAMHGHPGMVFHGCDRLKVFHPVLVRDGETTPIQVFAGNATIEDGVQRIPVELRGRRNVGREVVHSRAEMLLGAGSPRSESRSPDLRLPAFALDPDDVYQHVLFHGPELRGIERIIGSGPEGITVVAQSSPAPTLWLDQPLRGQWLADPLVLDCAFQAMSVWCNAERGAVSLPSAIGSYRQFRRFAKGPVTISCRVQPSPGQIVTARIDFNDADGPIARIEQFECVLDASLNQAFRRNRLQPIAV